MSVYYSLGYYPCGKEAVEEAAKALPEEILRHCARYRAPEAFRESVLTWTAMLELIGQCYPETGENLPIRFSPEGKPFCDGLYLSLSHTEGCYAICCGTTPCAVDIERVNPRYNFRRLLEMLEQPVPVDEAGQIQKFYTAWTRREARTKLEEGDREPGFYTTSFTSEEGGLYYLTLAGQENMERFGD